MSEQAVQRLRVVVAVGFPLGMAVTAGLLAVAGWPSYWTWVAPEQAPMAFFQAVMLLCAAFSAALLCLLAAQGGAPRRTIRIWAVVAVGFVGLMLDDQFYLHQRLRDAYLAPLGGGLPWGGPGDYVLVVYAAGGLLLLPLVLGLLRVDRLAFVLFVVGVGLTAGTVFADTFDVERMSPAMERLQQTLEEVGEGVAGALLAAALTAHLIGRLAAVVGTRASGSNAG